MNNWIINLVGRIWHKELYEVNCAGRFDEIIGHNDIKRFIVKAVHSKKPVHVLLVGSPASAKTMFLTDTTRWLKSSLFIVGSNTTKAGLLNQLFERRPKFLLIDELEKMNKTDQTVLLHLMESGIMTEVKFNKTRQMELTSWVIATANSCERIIPPLLSRFLVLEIPEYTFEEFKEIIVYRLKKENVDENTAIGIAEKVWDELDSRDIRDAVKVARLAGNLEEIQFVVGIMKTYRKKFL